MFVCFFLKVHHPPLDASESHAAVSQGGGSKAWPGISNRHSEPGGGSSPWWNGGAAERPWRRFEHALPSAQILFHTGTGAAAAALWVKKVHVQVCHLHSKHTSLLKQELDVVHRNTNSPREDFKCHLTH